MEVHCVRKLLLGREFGVLTSKSGGYCVKRLESSGYANLVINKVDAYTLRHIYSHTSLL